MDVQLTKRRSSLQFVSLSTSSHTNRITTNNDNLLEKATSVISGDSLKIPSELCSCTSCADLCFNPTVVHLTNTEENDATGNTDNDRSHGNTTTATTTKRIDLIQNLFRQKTINNHNNNKANDEDYQKITRWERLDMIRFEDSLQNLLLFSRISPKADTQSSPSHLGVSFGDNLLQRLH
ncbi:unnamed protein product [Trichobilharzia regenti]|nr:unnamed protein product [Trichobilharzia regenti]